MLQHLTLFNTEHDLKKLDMIQHLTSYVMLHLLWRGLTTIFALPVAHCSAAPEPLAILSASLVGSPTVDILFVDLMQAGERTKVLENQKCSSSPARNKTLMLLRIRDKTLKLETKLSSY
jgi:hypothetical protein